jgi:hypothetical protein
LNQRDLIRPLDKKVFSKDFLLSAVYHVYRHLFEERKTAEGTGKENENKHPSKIILD